MYTFSRLTLSFFSYFFYIYTYKGASARKVKEMERVRVCVNECE